MLQIEHLGLSLGSFVLRDVSFTLQAGDYFVLLGESGAGKSLILEAVAGVVPISSGSIHLNGRDLTCVAPHKRGLGLVYQEHALFPHLTVGRNIAYPLKRHTVRHPPERTLELARTVGVSDLLDRYPGTLSVGQAQRVALARALATEPAVLLLDEPLAALDVQARSTIRALLRKLHRAGQTILHVTHDYEEAIALATAVAVIEGGRISQAGTPDEVFHRPLSRFVATFVGVPNFYRGDLRRRDDGATEVIIEDKLAVVIATDIPSGPGSLIIRSEDVTLSLVRPQGSARNVFPGRITEVEPTPNGFRVSVDAGLYIHAKITRESARQLAVEAGQPIWVSFKSTALRFIPESGQAS